jgi:hypothetical protein
MIGPDSPLYRRVHLPIGVTLQLLGERGLLTRADFFVVNNSGETPLQLAQRVAAMKPLKAGADEVRNSLAAQVNMWSRDVRPVLMSRLAEVGLGPGPASAVLSFVDGSGPADAQPAASPRRHSR